MSTFEGEVRRLVYELPIAIRVSRTAQYGDQTPALLVGEEIAWAKAITQRGRGGGFDDDVSSFHNNSPGISDNEQAGSRVFPWRPVTSIAREDAQIRYAQLV